MQFSEKDVVYCVPIRFWEDKDPIKCVVKEGKQTDHISAMESSRDSVLVYCESHGHDVYINRKKLFFSEESCRSAIELYSKLNDLYHHDECDKLMEHLFEDTK